VTGWRDRDLGDVLESAPRGAPRGRRRVVASALGVALAATAVAVPLALRAHHHHDTAAVLRPTGGRDPASSYDVAPAPIPPESIPPPPLPVCRRDRIRTTGTLRATPNGVIGVVTAIGGTCHFPITMTPLALVSDGHAVAAIPLAGDLDQVNPATDIAAPALAVGRVALGFSWTGSWCGPAVDAVRLRYGRGTLDVPLHGPQAACRGRSASTLVAGAIGDIGEPVQSAPAAWRALRVTLRVRHNSPDAELTGLRATFTNSSPRPVALQPTPTYLIGVHDRLGDGATAEVVQPLPFPAQRLVVPAGGSLILHLPDTSYAADRRNFRTGYPITVTFAIAGVPDATAQTVVR